ncbi:hypothetical protein JCM11641_005305 [Rhodosporidiobolus odoratus]
MSPDSPPPQPSLLTTPASPPPPSTLYKALRASSSASSLRPIPIALPPPTHTHSRSPSPSPTVARFPSSATASPSSSPSATAALVQAGLGLIGCLPPSPALPSSGTFKLERAGADEMERLADPSTALSSSASTSRGLSPATELSRSGTARRRASSSVGFVEPDLPTREPNERERGRRERKKSFIGLGFNGSSKTPPTEDTEGSRSSFARRISFGALSGSGPAAVEDSSASHRPSPFPAPLPAPPPVPKKGRTLLRRAKSFGTTSPVLGALPNSSGAFSLPPAVPSPPPLPPSPVPPPSPILPALPRLSTSSLSLDPASARDSPSGSGFSTPLTPSSPFPYPCASSSVSLAGPTSESRLPRENPSTMVLPEPIPTAPHWLFVSAPTVTARDSSTSLQPNQGESDRDRRGSAGAQRRSSVEDAEKGKGKERETPGKKRTTRRATLGGLFGRKDTKTSLQAAEKEKERGASFEAARTSLDSGSLAGTSSVSGGPVFDSPTGSPALGTVNTPAGSPKSRSRENSSIPSSGGTIDSLPSLPSLPSLQLSNNSYRMSWAFGAPSSPTKSPTKNTFASPERRLSTANASPSPSTTASPARSRVNSRAPSTRPSLSITTTSPSASPGNSSPAPASPTKPLYSSPLSSTAPSPRLAAPIARPELQSAPSLPLPNPPPFVHAKSSDSASTLFPTASSSLPTSGDPLLSRGPNSSSPRFLRRSNSYVPPPSAAFASNGPPSYAPHTRSPLSSPAAEKGNPLAPSTSGSSPSLAKTLSRTRQGRSHSDASDRRSPTTPSTSPPPHSNFSYGGARNMVVGGMGFPAGGGYFAQAHQKVGASRNSGDGVPRRPSTSGESGGSGGGRTSVFGSLGSFFHSSGSNSSTAALGSQGMSRSSSAATTTASAAETPINEYGGGASEFGALFGGSEADKKRSASVSRPGMGRKRGLSVGAGIGSLFGHGGANLVREGPLALPLGSPSGSPSRPARERGRSDSAGSAMTTGSNGGLAPPDVVGGRVRALTDPSRRVSYHGGGSPSSSSAGLAPPSVSPRPGTSDGSLSAPGAGKGGRGRGSSLSNVVAGPGALPDRPPPPKERKIPQPREDEGEKPEDWLKRLMEGEPPKKMRRRKETPLSERNEDEETEELAEDDASEYEEAEDEGTEPLPKGDITRALAASSDEFHTAALAVYLRLFPFQQLALDIALRVFLSAASLPSETQQIDRVMEAFARRYCECNPGVFAGKKAPLDAASPPHVEGTKKAKDGEDSDIPYVLAFSMVMLNTDQFNPNAKSKMTKADYLKNTRIDGVAPEILEYLYDQITLAPFVFVDSQETNDSSSFILAPSTTSSMPGASSGPGAAAPLATPALPTSSGFFGASKEKGKFDPYSLIATGQTSRFRVDVESHIPSKSPFSYTGTTSFFNATTLHSLFAKAPVLQIVSRARSSSKSSPNPSPFFTPASPVPPLPGSTLPASNGSSPPEAALAGSPLLPTVSNGTFIAETPKKKAAPTATNLKITKVGLLSRKEDLAEGGKKAASRKWKGWTVVLTGSQLLFFKDPNFAASLQQALDAAASSSESKPDDSHVLVFSISTPFKPDAVLSLANSAAIYDTSYSKYQNVFRLVAPAGRQYLFQAYDADNLNSWLHAINFAAAFKTANVRMRPLLPLSPPGSTSNSSRPSPVSTSPLLPSVLRHHEPTTAGPPILPQPPHVRPVNRTTTGSLASTVSVKSSLGPTEEDETIQPRTLEHVSADDLLPRSLQAALEATGGHNRTQFAGNRTATPPDAVSPRPSEASLVAAGLPSITARADLLRTKLYGLDAEIAQARGVLQADLRLAKHLAILTPFRSSTREKILTAISPIEKRVRQARMNLAKLVCYREVLSRDLLVEDRETERLVRKHSPSLRRPRPSSPRQSSSHVHANGANHASPLSHPISSLHPPRLDPHTSHSDTEATPRSSFDSVSESLADPFDILHLQQPTSYTDDELDRLVVRSPPTMSRSRTEDFEALTAHAAGLNGLGIPLHSSHGLGDHHLCHPSEDELQEVLPTYDSNARAGTPMQERSTDPGELLVRGLRPLAYTIGPGQGAQTGEP